MAQVMHGRGRRGVRTGAFALVVLLALVAAPVAAADQGNGSTNGSRFQHIDLGTVGLGDGTGAKFVPASMSDEQVSVMLKMQGAPVASRGKLSPAEKAAVRAQLKAGQDAISQAVAKAGGTIVGQTQDAYNGILVHAKKKDLAALASLPGVTGIQPVGLHDVPTNVNGVPLIKAPQAWGTNLTGAGVKIAVIDTGVDYTHADFGGAGTAAAYTAAHARSTQPPLPNEVGPAAPKVKGGWDFAGDDYDASTPAKSTPQPDPNPLDCNGHGSHVSGTVTGFGVTDTGATYGGPYNATTVSSHNWTIGPGVAPKADLYLYRVFGCTGSTDLTILAINKAVEDQVDVISMSLGSPFGTSDQNDAELTAVNNAAAAGITVVAAAGNNGQNAYIVGAPSSASHALSVAAVDGSVPTYPGGLFHLSSTSSITAIDANGAAFSDGLSGKVRVLRDPSGGVSIGCDPNEYAGSTGMIVVTQRGVCARVARAIFGQKAGAAAVVMINSSPGLPPFEGQITSNPDTGEQFTVTIPFFGVNGPVTSNDAKALIAADGQTITIDNTPVSNTGFMRNASFTSGGPRNGDSAAKPEIAAPGVSVSSVLVGGGTKATILSGTSMATPMTSGVAALVQQAHSGWHGDQIKAALVNTANAGLIGGFNGRLDGSGFVQADAATDTVSLATTGDGLDSLSFGYAEKASGDWTASKTFTVTNYGTSPITYNTTPTKANSGAAWSLAVTSPAGSFTVDPGASQDVTVSATIPAATFAVLPSASTFVTGIGQVLTLRGDVTVAPTATGPGVHSLRVPVLIAPRGLSSVTAAAPAPFAKQQTGNVYTGSVTLTNGGVHPGTADVYSWGIQDAKDLDSGLGQDVRAVGLQTFDDGTLVFAVNGWNQSSTQATQEYDVAIDTQHNGKPDFFVVGVDIGAVTTGTFDGRVGSFTIDAKTGALVDAFVADAPMNGSTVLLPTTASDLGLGKAGKTSFNYAVNGFSIFGGAVDTTSWAPYDLAKQALSTGQFAPVAANGGTATIPLVADFDKLRVSPALGWLIVNVDDAAGTAQAETIPVNLK